MPANTLSLNFSGLSVKAPYKHQMSLKFTGLQVTTQKAANLRFWGMSAKDAGDCVTLIDIK